MFIGTSPYPGRAAGEESISFESPRSSPAALAQQLFLFNIALLRERYLLTKQFHLRSGYARLVSRLHYYANGAALFLLDLINTGVLQHSLKVPRSVPCSQSTAVPNPGDWVSVAFNDCTVNSGIVALVAYTTCRKTMLFKRMC